MKVAIHQPHYFPWIGYFDKMAKADKFVLLDEVQFEKGSQMIRNRVVDTNGGIKYITISGDTKDFLNLEYRQLLTKDISKWTRRQCLALQNYYRKAPFFYEIAPILEKFYENDYKTICEWTCESLKLICELLEIKTTIIYQSSIEYDRKNKKSDLVYEICKVLRSDTYFSGRGASVNYLDREKFKENGVNIIFQDFTHPVYPQINTAEFVMGISVLDMLFNCGIEKSREIFWENVRASNEFNDI